MTAPSRPCQVNANVKWPAFVYHYYWDTKEFTDWALTADRHGGTRLPGVLLADTLDELCAMLPAGLTRRDRTVVMPETVLGRKAPPRKTAR